MTCWHSLSVCATICYPLFPTAWLPWMYFSFSLWFQWTVKICHILFYNHAVFFSSAYTSHILSCCSTKYRKEQFLTLHLGVQILVCYSPIYIYINNKRNWSPPMIDVLHSVLAFLIYRNISLLCLLIISQRSGFFLLMLFSVQSRIFWHAKLNASLIQIPLEVAATFVLSFPLQLLTQFLFFSIW